MEKLLSIEDVQAGLKDYVPDLDSRMDSQVKLVVDYLTECFVCAYNHILEQEERVVDLKETYMRDYLEIPIDAEMAVVIMDGIEVCISGGSGAEKLIRVLNAVYPEVVEQYTYINAVNKIVEEGKCVTP